MCLHLVGIVSCMRASIPGSNHAHTSHAQGLIWSAGPPALQYVGSDCCSRLYPVVAPAPALLAAAVAVLCMPLVQAMPQQLAAQHLLDLSPAQLVELTAL